MAIIDKNGNSAMFEACKRGHAEVVQLLLDYNAPYVGWAACQVDWITVTKL